jgi:hypothetical protein
VHNQQVERENQELKKRSLEREAVLRTIAEGVRKEVNFFLSAIAGRVYTDARRRRRLDWIRAFFCGRRYFQRASAPTPLLLQPGIHKSAVRQRPSRATMLKPSRSSSIG